MSDKTGAFLVGQEDNHLLQWAAGSVAHHSRGADHSCERQRL